MADTPQTLQSILKIAREKLGKSQNEIANAIGMSRRNYSRLEGGKVKLLHKYIPVVAKVLKLSEQVLRQAQRRSTRAPRKPCNVLPLLRAITQAGINSLTTIELIWLTEQQVQLGRKSLAPELVISLLKHRRGK